MLADLGVSEVGQRRRSENLDVGNAGGIGGIGKHGNALGHGIAGGGLLGGRIGSGHRDALGRFEEEGRRILHDLRGLNGHGHNRRRLLCGLGGAAGQRQRHRTIQGPTS